MEELNGATIYWLISIGLLVGLFIDLIMPHGISLMGNLINGVIGSVIIGVLVIMIGLFAPLVYATIGAISFLFLVNVFKIEPDESKQAEVLKK